jgi:NTP pyrophosphatase (non-canonical NTP hydrolase)
VDELRDNINKALDGACETYWCDGCKMPVYEDHGHRAMMVPIKKRPEADCYIMLHQRIQAALDETKETVREPVRWFAEQMERKLAQHDDRPGWKGEDFEYLLIRLMGELGELCNLQPGTELQTVIDEAADVANFAMMISDNARSLMQDNSKEVS